MAFENYQTLTQSTSAGSMLGNREAMGIYPKGFSSAAIISRFFSPTVNLVPTSRRETDSTHICQVFTVEFAFSTPRPLPAIDYSNI